MIISKNIAAGQNMLKEKIIAREKICGTHISMGNGYIADIFAMAGFDFVWIDTEHSVIDYKELLNCITIIRAHGVPVIVRVQVDNYNHTKRVLEMGVDGIIFPSVDTAEYAQKCIASTYYPPVGNRGFGPLRAVNYGFSDSDEYIRHQERLCRFVQLESTRAIENLSDIVKNPYIDGYIFGPCDLSGTLGKPNQIYCAENLALIQKAIGILKEHGKYIGVSLGSTQEADQKKWLEMGVDMISSGTDYDYILRAAKENCIQMHRLMGNELVKG